VARRHQLKWAPRPQRSSVFDTPPVIVGRDTIFKQQLAAAITQIGGAGVSREGSGGAPGVGAPTHTSHRGSAPGAKQWRPARSTISQLDDNIRRHHRRFYGVYVAEFSSRVTGAARAHIGDPGRASKPARKRAAASTSSGCRSD
jgi:hypothetical protein